MPAITPENAEPNPALMKLPIAGWEPVRSYESWSPSIVIFTFTGIRPSPFDGS